MSAYSSPSHNRLLDLEHHLRGKRSGVVLTHRSPTRSANPQKQQRKKAQRQRARPTNLAPDSRLPSQPQSYPNISPNGFNNQAPEPTPYSAAYSEPPAASKLPAPSVGSYRQLAAQMGKYYESRPAVRPLHKKQSEMPAPIKPEILTEATAQLEPTIETPVDQSAPPPTRWKTLAMAIRRAKLGQLAPETAPETNENLTPASPPISASHPSETQLSTPDQPAGPICKPSTLSISAEPIGAELHSSPAATAASPTQSPPSDSSPVTIDVTPIASTKDTGSPIIALSPSTPKALLPPNLEIEHSKTALAPVSARDNRVFKSDSELAGLRDNLLLLTYQLAWPPEVVQYLAACVSTKDAHPRKRAKAKRLSSIKQLVLSS